MEMFNPLKGKLRRTHYEGLQFKFTMTQQDYAIQAKIGHVQVSLPGGQSPRTLMIMLLRRLITNFLSLSTLKCCTLSPRPLPSLQPQVGLTSIVCVRLGGVAWLHPHNACDIINLVSSIMSEPKPFVEASIILKKPDQSNVTRFKYVSLQ